MPQEVWINPNNSSQIVRINSNLTPPRQAGTSNVSAGSAQVPSGYIKQNGLDGYMDTNFYVAGQAVPNFTIPGVPYYVGVLTPVLGFDPLAGQPYHTAPNVNRQDGIND